VLSPVVTPSRVLLPLPPQEDSEDKEEREGGKAEESGEGKESADQEHARHGGPCARAEPGCRRGASFQAAPCRRCQQRPCSAAGAVSQTRQSQDLPHPEVCRPSTAKVGLQLPVSRCWRLLPAGFGGPFHGCWCRPLVGWLEAVQLLTLPREPWRASSPGGGRRRAKTADPRPGRRVNFRSADADQLGIRRTGCRSAGLVWGAGRTRRAVSG